MPWRAKEVEKSKNMMLHLKKKHKKENTSIKDPYLVFVQSILYNGGKTTQFIRNNFKHTQNNTYFFFAPFRSNTFNTLLLILRLSLSLLHFLFAHLFTSKHKENYSMQKHCI